MGDHRARLVDRRLQDWRRPARGRPRSRSAGTPRPGSPPENTPGCRRSAALAARRGDRIMARVGERSVSVVGSSVRAVTVDSNDVSGLRSSPPSTAKNWSWARLAASIASLASSRPPPASGPWHVGSLDEGRHRFKAPLLRKSCPPACRVWTATASSLSPVSTTIGTWGEWACTWLNVSIPWLSGQREVQQSHVDAPLGEALEPGLEVCGVRQLELRRRSPLPESPGSGGRPPRCPRSEGP